MTRVEIVCQSAEDALMAQDAGADRIELCSAIETGGLTPSSGLIQVVMREVEIPVVVMVRPRPAGFCYSRVEQDVITAEAARLAELQVDGLVFGAVDNGGQIDEPLLARIVDAARGVPITFHRVFDIMPNPLAAVRKLAGLGIRRLLCSGSLEGAEPGIELLAAIKKEMSDQFEIVAAGGIRSGNAVRIAEQSGCDFVHLAPLQKREDAQGHSGLYGNEFSALDFDEAKRVVESLRAAGQ